MRYFVWLHEYTREHLLSGSIPLWNPYNYCGMPFAANLQALSNEFVNWDDKPVLLDITEWRGLGAEQLGWMFTTYHYGHYQPITWLIVLDHVEVVLGRRPDDAVAAQLKRKQEVDAGPPP